MQSLNKTSIFKPIQAKEKILKIYLLKELFKAGFNIKVQLTKKLTA
jgi:hypothetical protein